MLLVFQRRDPTAVGFGIIWLTQNVIGDRPVAISNSELGVRPDRVGVVFDRQLVQTKAGICESAIVVGEGITWV